MKGDFTRNTFDPIRHFSRVLMQQGRVQLDADFNEQTAILLRYLRTLASDLVGPYWGPADPDKRGFAIGDPSAGNNGDFRIGKGHYYVDGILCENDEKNLTYRAQAGFKDASVPDNKDKVYFVYLDVWERHITPIQADHIRELALGGPDTCTRAQVIWQVKWWASDKNSPDCNDAAKWVKTLGKRQPVMKARVSPEYEDNNACSIPPESRYRGPENQLYRIEVHRGGNAWKVEKNKDGTPAGNHECAATFKWSRDNGSVVFPIVWRQGEVVKLQTLGQDQRTRLQIDDWVEIIDDDIELRGEPGILAQVYEIDPVELTVKLKLLDDLTAVNCPVYGVYDQPRTDPWQSYDENSRNHPLLRRWDQRAAEGLAMSRGAILISESAQPKDGWIEIEDGIEVQFQPPDQSEPYVYRTGDYWLVPARVETGKIDWPPGSDDKGTVIRDSQGNEEPAAKPPDGITHCYAPLAVISSEKATDCRCYVETILKCPSLS